MTLTNVHFHQGPQGQPMPCYDDRCSMPALDVAGYDGASRHSHRERGTRGSRIRRALRRPR